MARVTVRARPPSAWSPRGWPSERPTGDPATLEAWCYTDRFSYSVGERIDVCVHTTAPEFELEIVRDGAMPESVLELAGQPGVAHDTAADCYATGCGWPIALSLDVPSEWPSGLYLLIIRARGDDGEIVEREHFFVIRSPRPGQDTPLALILTTSTLIAYNDWGGANHYRGIGDDPRNDVASPLLSIHRPIGRGMLRKPVGVPRAAFPGAAPPGWRPRYPSIEWARLNGYSRHHADAGWATYERPFAVWAAQAGFELDYLTQHDLQHDPGALDAYRCAVVVGHDEYWTWEMRDALDGFLDGGGNLARFAGNYLWQVRLEREATTQACYRLPDLDPITASDPQRVSTIWDSLIVARPGAQTMGLTGTAGIYSRYGVASPRSSGGFTVYRPEHWALAGTDLYYGDLIGGAPICAAAFELDGVDYTFRRGLPYPTFEDGAPESLEIIAMTPAGPGEEDRFAGAVPLAGPAEDFPRLVAALGEQAPSHLREARYGAGMIGSFTHGKGTVFNAGSTEWVNGLINRDPFIERITRTVLERLSH